MNIYERIRFIKSQPLTMFSLRELVQLHQFLYSYSPNSDEFRFLVETLNDYDLYSSEKLLATCLYITISYSSIIYVRDIQQFILDVHKQYIVTSYNPDAFAVDLQSVRRQRTSDNFRAENMDLPTYINLVVPIYISRLESNTQHGLVSCKTLLPRVISGGHLSTVHNNVDVSITNPLYYFHTLYGFSYEAVSYNVPVITSEVSSMFRAFYDRNFQL